MLNKFWNPDVGGSNAAEAILVEAIPVDLFCDEYMDSKGKSHKRGPTSSHTDSGRSKKSRSSGFDDTMSSDIENNAMEISSEEDEVIEDFMDFLMIAFMHDHINPSSSRRPQRTYPFKRDDYISSLLNGHPETMMDIMRMDALTFISLKDTLLQNDFIDTEHMHISVEESLGIFLYTFTQNDRHRLLVDRFQHSSETICRYIKIVMRALCKLASTVIKPPNQDEFPTKILNDMRFFPWFKDCVDAIDGTLMDAWVSVSRQNTFHGRKSTVSQNVLAACDFDMLFTFINSGWEGSAHDKAILVDSITRVDLQFPHPPNGKYYLVDAGFTNMPGFLAPFRSQRYHLQEFHSRHYSGPKELFNHRHLSLRNVIERTFGVLKKRFPILRSMPNYKSTRQGPLVIACCVVHNWIRLHAVMDPFFMEADNEMAAEGEADGLVEHQFDYVDMSQHGLTYQSNFRDALSTVMWQNRVGHG
ncbi:uncharacterized protein LOC114307790 [Camellia sinensis]|uniref:uncharacterized protein LOC114307790 n=1 Tax=Camellia sinensis TaxID=4442 RepID=UPI0010361006|nr:uncharacterized protein LOC114307790 [Camellia sinensis]